MKKKAKFQISFRKLKAPPRAPEVAQKERDRLIDEFLKKHSVKKIPAAHARFW